MNTLPRTKHSQSHKVAKHVRKLFVICLSSCFAPMRMQTKGVSIFRGYEPKDEGGAIVLAVREKKFIKRHDTILVHYNPRLPQRSVPALLLQQQQCSMSALRRSPERIRTYLL
jgi:hypothetical protein